MAAIAIVAVAANRRASLARGGTTQASVARALVKLSHNRSVIVGVVVSAHLGAAALLLWFMLNASERDDAPRCPPRFHFVTRSKRP